MISGERPLDVEVMYAIIEDRLSRELDHENCIRLLMIYLIIGEDRKV